MTFNLIGYAVLIWNYIYY